MHLAHLGSYVHCPVLYVLIRGELEGGKPFAPLGVRLDELQEAILQILCVVRLDELKGGNFTNPMCCSFRYPPGGYFTNPVCRSFR